MLSSLRGGPGLVNGVSKAHGRNVNLILEAVGSHCIFLSEDDLMKLTCENTDPEVINRMRWRIKELSEGHLGDGDKMQVLRHELPN